MSLFLDKQNLLSKYSCVLIDTYFVYTLSAITYYIRTISDPAWHRICVWN